MRNTSTLYITHSFSEYALTKTDVDNRREVQDHGQEAREFYEYYDLLEREPDPLFGALAGVGAGGSLAGGLLSAIGNVVPGKAGEGLSGAGQVIAGVGKSLAGRRCVRQIL